MRTKTVSLVKYGSVGRTIGLLIVADMELNGKLSVNLNFLGRDNTVVESGSVTLESERDGYNVFELKMDAGRNRHFCYAEIDMLSGVRFISDAYFSTAGELLA